MIFLAKVSHTERRGGCVAKLLTTIPTQRDGPFVQSKDAGSTTGVLPPLSARPQAWQGRTTAHITVSVSKLQQPCFSQSGPRHTEYEQQWAEHSVHPVANSLSSWELCMSRFQCMAQHLLLQPQSPGWSGTSLPLSQGCSGHTPRPGISVFSYCASVPLQHM